MVAYVSGKLSAGEKVKVQAYLLANPAAITTVHELAKLKRSLGNEVDLKQYLDEQVEGITQKVLAGL
ncbi:MAG: hypothetical protein IT258_18500 [Saprospiraceae bacterium]|nr:hypothetical protein [Saprospiraceae bacterium]